MITIVPDTKVDDVVCCCLVHKEMPSIAIKGDSDLVNLGVKALYYCPVPGCESFRCNDGMIMWEHLYTRFGVSFLPPYMKMTQEQRTLQQFSRFIFLLMIRVQILMDKEKRRTARE